jgi:Tol biopolymer transport system component
LPQSETGGNQQIIDQGTGGNIGGIPNKETGDKQPEAPKGAIDELASGGITKTQQLTDTPSFNILKNGNGVSYYDAKDNRFYTIDANGNKTALSDKQFYNVSNVSWSPTKGKAVIEYPDKSKIIYDFKTDKQITLPKHWEDFSFSPTGDNLVLKSLGNDPDNRWLAVADGNGGNVKTIGQIGDASTVYPDWSPNQQSVATYTNGEGLDTQKVYFVGLNGENFKAATIEGRDFRPMWSPKGDRLLYSVYSAASDLKPTLWVVDAQGNAIGNDRQKLNIDTWSNKCAFADNETLYCAVPSTLEKGAGMFPKMADNTSDTIYRINTTTGFKEQVAIPEGQHSVSEITTSEDGKTLFFNDKTGQLYKINIQ